MENPEYVKKARERVKKWRKENKEKYLEQAKRYRENNKLERIARDKCKRIPIDSSCNICHSKEDLEKHHWRYDKPLMFNTLCKFCHDVQHGRKII